MSANFILDGLSKVGALVSEAIKNKAKNNRVPKVDGATYVDPAQLDFDDGVGKISAHVDIVIDLKEAPAARAYEYGSGIHDEDNPEFIKIEPKNATALGIPESRWPDFQYPVKSGKKMIGLYSGKFVLRYVDHPGVEKRPYIKPAINDTKSQVLSILGKAVVAQIRAGIKSETIEIK